LAFCFFYVLSCCSVWVTGHRSHLLVYTPSWEWPCHGTGQLP
jgi:hypothetical protein